MTARFPSARTIMVKAWLRQALMSKVRRQDARPTKIFTVLAHRSQACGFSRQRCWVRTFTVVGQVSERERDHNSSSYLALPSVVVASLPPRVKSPAPPQLPLLLLPLFPSHSHPRVVRQHSPLSSASSGINSSSCSYPLDSQFFLSPIENPTQVFA